MAIKTLICKMHVLWELLLSIWGLILSKQLCDFHLRKHFHRTDQPIIIKCIFAAGDSHVQLSGFRSDPSPQKACSRTPQCYGCRDALVSERYLTLAFTDRTECWSLDETDSAPVWRMEHAPQESAGMNPTKNRYVCTFVQLTG